MSEVTWSPVCDPTRGLITGMRFGLFKPGLSRVVLDSAGPVKITKAFMVKPAPGRLPVVLDISRDSETAFMTAYKQSGERVQPRVKHLPPPGPPQVKSSSKKDEKAVIMIDPGHGALTLGDKPVGVWEKHIVLAFSKELRRPALATGKFDVRMTRNRDVFIRLRERIARAKHVGADLFLDPRGFDPDRKVRGASVYTLSERASDKEADELAQKENRISSPGWTLNISPTRSLIS